MLHAMSSIAVRLPQFDASVAAAGPSGAGTLPTPTRAAGNGVRHWEAGSRPEIQDRGDIYVLPEGQDGVPRQITVVPRKWWGGGKLEALDGSGNPLKIKRWASDLMVTDAKTGVTTRLNPETLEVTVSSELITRTRPIMSGSREIRDCKLSERLAPNGDIFVRTNYHGVEERMVYGMVREMPPTETMVVALDEDYEETVIPADGPTVSRQMHRQRHQEPVEKAIVLSHVDQSGDLTIDRPGADDEIFHLFIPPHALPGA